MFSAPQCLAPTDEEAARERMREICHLLWLRGDIHETHCTPVPISRSPLVFHDHWCMKDMLEGLVQVVSSIFECSQVHRNKGGQFPNYF